MISARKAKHLDVTTMFTYSNANTPLSQSVHVYYLSYLIIVNGRYIKGVSFLSKIGQGLPVIKFVKYSPSSS